MELHKIYTKHFPVKGFTALTIWPFVFIRKDCTDRYGVTIERHENIHAEQQKELLVVPFFILYIVEFLIKLFFCKFNLDLAYCSVCFEQEAFDMQYNEKYLETRKHYSWSKYIFKIA